MATNKKQTEETGAALNVTDRAGAEAALSGAEYQKSQSVQDAEAALNAWQSQKPAEYVSSYQDKIDGMLDKILNREGFSYDFSADPLYQSYKDGYTHAGRLAMQDAAAGAAASTGGYGSSYAASAGSQAYQGYLAKMNDKLPDLYEAALSRYTAEDTAMRSALDTLTTQEKSSRAAYEDSVSDYYKGLSAATDRAETLSKADYAAYQDRLSSLTDLRDYYAGQQQQQVKNELSRQEYALALEKYQESVRQWEAEQAAAQAKWQAQLSEDARQFDTEMQYKTAKATATAASRSTASAAKTVSSSKTSTSSKTGTSSNAQSKTTSDTKTDTKRKANALQQDSTLRKGWN